MKEEVWARVLEANPEMRPPEGHCLNLNEARKFFEVVWNNAYEAGVRDALDRLKETGQMPPSAELPEAVKVAIKLVTIDKLAAALEAAAREQKGEKKSAKDKKKTDDGGK
jgi:hypothetical protein